MATNPVLNEINGLSPGAKTALLNAHQASNPPATPAPIAGLHAPSQIPSAPMMGVTPPPSVDAKGLASATATPPPSLSAPSAPNVALSPSPRGTLIGDQEKLSHDLSTGSGISQIHSKIENSSFGQNHPFLGKLAGWGAQIPAQIADIGVSALAPAITANTPGTEYHHLRDIKQDQGQVAGDTANEEKQAEAANQTSQAGEHAEATQEMPVKLQQGQSKIDVTQQKADDAKALKLAQQGQIEITGADGQTHVVDDPGSQVYKTRQALTDYHAAQTTLDQARTELAHAQNDPNSPAYRLAVQKVQTASENAAAAGERAQAYMLNAQGGNLGTYNGQPLPGAILTNEGQPVGSRFETNVRPTGAQRGKGNMAESADEQLHDIQSIMVKHADLFGPGYGQSAAFKKWIGEQSPDAQRFLSARTIAADHLAATFGGRSEAALSALDSAIGKFKDNPEAARAGIDQLLKANRVFEKAGHFNTVGGNRSNPDPAEESPSEETRTYQGHTYVKGPQGWHLQQ